MNHQHFRRTLADSTNEDMGSSSAPSSVMSTVYMAYDGDNAGRLVGQAVLADNAQQLSEISEKIANGHEVVRAWVENHGGQIISGGGDEGTFMIPADAANDIETLRADYNFATGLTATVGVGKTLSQAGKALMAGKFRGKDQVVQYDDSVEQELSQAQEHVAAGSGSEEENKIAEAYLGDCKYCKETEDHSDDCQYCAEHDAAMSSESDCQYCAEADAREAEGADHEHTGDDCQYCQEMESQSSADHEHTGDDCQYCQEAANDAQAQGEPNEEESQEASEGEEEAIPQGAPEENHAAPTEEGEEDLETIASQIESDDPETQSERGIINDIDDSDVAIGQSMDGGISRPDGFDQPSAPGEQGQSEDISDEDADEQSPDLGGVLKQGLDESSDDIQKEKVMVMVAHALEAFRASKDFIEQNKEAAPHLYESSIAMLKAMIEMAKMLGLGNGEAPAEEAPETAPEEENEWHDPFPVHPDNAAGQEDAAEAPQQ